MTIVIPNVSLLAKKAYIMHLIQLKRDEIEELESSCIYSGYSAERMPKSTTPNYIKESMIDKKSELEFLYDILEKLNTNQPLNSF